MNDLILIYRKIIENLILEFKIENKIEFRKNMAELVEYSSEKQDAEFYNYLTELLLSYSTLSNEEIEDKIKKVSNE